MKPLKWRVLCVDDDVDSCELLTYMLSSAADAYTLTSVHHGDKAKELITERSFDLYILDLWMPGTDGLDLCRWIRGRDAHTPILFFTASAQDEVRRSAMDAGGDAYLIKPNDLGKLTTTVRRLLRGIPVPSYRKGILNQDSVQIMN